MASNSTKPISCAVAMIDILGLKRLLQRRSLNEIADTVMSSFASSMSPALGETSIGRESASDLTERFIRDIGFETLPGPISILVSDSILSFFPLVEGDQEDTPIIKAAAFLRNAIAICSESDIWLRGAISYGKCLLSEHMSGLIALGPPIAEAYEWERNQNWIGGILAPSAARCVKRLLKELPRHNPIRAACSENRDLLVTYDVPLKNPFPSGCPLIAINLARVTNLTGGVFRLPPTQTRRTHSEIATKHANTRQFIAALRGTTAL